ncbi:MAG TPA: alkaline phosphatase D family protein [Allosphingosinicella sp.]
MSGTIDRRLLLKAGALGLGALAAPGAAQLLAARGFTHNVASGEPRQRSVMLWTRYVPEPGRTGLLTYEVSRTDDFARIASRGTVGADPERDFCVKPVAGGLMPGQAYFYRFRDSAGATSPVGRTRTLPEGRVRRFRIAVFSCANLPSGWFNAYDHAAGRADIDLVLHLGDYFYEYQEGRYPRGVPSMAGRVLDPASEVVHLADYRLRYAAYRADPDLQRLHQMFPMVMMWDDHESANNSWQGGADNHQPESEGPWEVRKAAAMRVCREWLPVGENDWQSYEIGDLATLFRPETRLIGRSRPPSFAAAVAGQADIMAALRAFRDGDWQNPARTMLGADQERWLADGLRRSVGQGKKWQILGQQTVMGHASLAPEVAGWLTPAASAELRLQLTVGVAAGRLGLPFTLDSWDGYPAARDRLLRSALDANANLLVLSGDSHNAWGFDLTLGGAAAGAEFAGQSVTSPGYETYLPWVDPADLARAMVAFNPGLKWAETGRRGYLTVELTPERATGEWLFLDTIRERSTTIAARHGMTVTRGTNRLG